MKKIKRLFSAALALTLSITATINLTACEQVLGFLNQSEESSHSHTFSEWTLSNDATNCNGGTFTRVCTECTEMEERAGTDADHKWSQTYEVSTAHHWAECERCGATTTKVPHEEDGAGLCRVCDYMLPTACVSFQISNNGKYAIVTGYDEAETDAVVIADTYEGLPVKEIQAGAFEGCTSLSRVILPSTITTIGKNAFNGCKRLLGIYISKQVTSLGENAFYGCSELTIFTEYSKEDVPSAWRETLRASALVIWNYAEKKAANVSAKASMIIESPLYIVSEKSQLVLNDDLNNVKPPEGFSSLTRYDSKTTPPGEPWTSGNLWYYNWNPMKLSEYSEVWFAIKAVNAYWVFIHNVDIDTSLPWAYFHLKQVGETEDGFTAWNVELSIGGYVYSTIVNQTGRYIDDGRPSNSIPRLLWDEGFSSPDKNAMLLYLYNSELPVTIYCTEVRGFKLGV